MIMTISIGNTSVYTGFFVDDEPMVLRLPTKPVRSVEEFRSAILKAIQEWGLPNPEEGIIASVVPAYTEPVKAMLADICGSPPLVVTHRTVKDMKFAVKTPEALGPDRIAAAYGAWKLYGGPVAVIDMGTATTVNFVTENGIFLGGAIMPGVALMRDSLKERTAKLPRVELERPAGPIGTDTIESILAGVVFGTAGAVGRILEEAGRERLEVFKVVATGGHAELIAPFLKRMDYLEPSLVLKGMRLISMMAGARAG